MRVMRNSLRNDMELTNDNLIVNLIMLHRCNLSQNQPWLMQIWDLGLLSCMFNFADDATS